MTRSGNLPSGRLLGYLSQWMPAPCLGADDKKTKYTKEGSLQLMQWKSAKGAKVATATVTT
jgi:hypothetical protein